MTVLLPLYNLDSPAAIPVAGAPHGSLGTRRAFASGGERRWVKERELVPGDVVLLEAGNIVPADLRVIETADLSVDEAALTGESLAVAKDATADVPLDAMPGDRANMTHKGTQVTRGRARS